MSKKAPHIFVFRQDLRVRDNSGLQACLESQGPVLPVFILDKNILKDFPKNDKRMEFLYNALFQLDKELQKIGIELLIFRGDSTTLIPKIAEAVNAKDLHFNRSYGIGSRTRDYRLKKRASGKRETLHRYDDYLLVEPATVKQMKVFTPFYKRWMGKRKELPNLEVHGKYKLPENAHKLKKWKSYQDIEKFKTSRHDYRPVAYGNDLLNQIPIKGYDDKRNFPADKDGTSKLSPYLAFGLISPREVLTKVIDEQTPGVSIKQDKKNNKKTITMDKDAFENSYVSELAWREFWHHIGYFFPQTRSREFLKKYRKIERNNNEKWFDARKNSKTGYPIVDAAMRQLKEENWMHGRCRMIVASFLTKDLMIDRRRGEKHFKDYLLDYDINVNIGNWQWSASVGADPKPLRIFNPILQSERYDPNAEYIKKWLPELKDQKVAAIHNPLENDLDRHKPIVNHYKASKEAKKMYYASRDKYKN